MLFTRSYRGCYRPAGIPRIDPTHPLAAGLTSCVLPIAPGAVVDLVRWHGFAARTGSIFARTAMGEATGNWTLGKSDGSDTPEFDWTSGPFTAACWANFTEPTGGNFPTPFTRSIYTNEASNSGWALQVRPGEAYAFIVLGNRASGTYATISTGVSVYVPGDHLFMGTHDGGTTGTVYVDRNISATSSGITPPPGISCASALVCDAHSSLYIGWTWNRQLSAAERASLYADPYGMLIFPADELQWQQFVGAGGPPPSFLPAWAARANPIYGTGPIR